MLNRIDVQFHSGPPQLPVECELLSAFATVVASASISRGLTTNSDAMRHARRQLADSVFDTLYGTLRKDLEQLRAQVHNALMKMCDRPEDWVTLGSELDTAIRRIIEKTSGE